MLREFENGVLGRINFVNRVNAKNEFNHFQFLIGISSVADGWGIISKIQ